MKQTRTTVILTSLALLLLIGLTACGGGQAQTQDYASSGTDSNSSSGQATQTEDDHSDDPPAEAESQGDPVAGKEAFVACAACHGPAGEGMPGLGKDMTTSEFIAEKTDTELVEFIKVGRDPSDPLNTTGVGMPARGGNPALSDEDLYNIVAYIRSLHE